MTTLLRKVLLSAFVAFSAVSCSDEEEVITVNKLDAKAGQDQHVKVNVLVTLDGSASSDGNSKPFTYEWSFKTRPSLSSAIIQFPNAVVSKFKPDTPGLYVLQLAIRQNSFLKTDDVVITVTETDTDPEPATVLISDNINSDRVLDDIFTDPQVPDYRVNADVNVNGKLTISPGVVIEFDQDKSLVIYPQGSIIAVGETDNRISFKGKESTRGYWKGILIHSNNLNNVLEHVTVSDAGGRLHSEMPNGLLANVSIAGSDYAGGSLKILHSSFINGNGYGLYVQGKSALPLFSANVFSANNRSAAYVPASQLHRMDNASSYNGNGFDGVETGGAINNSENVIWKQLPGGSKYLVSNDLIIESGVSVAAGSIFEFETGVTVTVESNGFFNATGTSESRIIFTSRWQVPNQYWTGILYKTWSDMNALHFVKISHAGLEPLPVFTSIKANVAVAGTGKALITHSTIEHGLGWGIAAEYGSQLNPDVSTTNSFINLQDGNVKLPVTAEPETTTLAGEWVDYQSFVTEHYEVDSDFYDQETNTWFGGAPDPWSMTPQTGFGLKISEDGAYTWTIAQRGPMGECISYNAEHIEGHLTFTSATLSFIEGFWRSTFYNSCDPAQNVDIDVEPGHMELQYQISRMYDVLTGEAKSWELKIFNPDGSFFTYYRK